MLLAAQGLQNKDIAEQLGIGRAGQALARALPGVWPARHRTRPPRGAPPVKVDVAKLVETHDAEHARCSHALEYAQEAAVLEVIPAR